MSIFQGKTLEQQVDGVKSTMELRKAKITGKIASLNHEAKQLLSQIETDTSKMLELELIDDNQAADKLRKTSRTARTRLEEINGEIEGYNTQLKNNCPLNKDDIEKFRVLAQKEMKDNRQKIDLLYEKISALESQKDEIEEKIKAIKIDAGKITNDSIEGSMYDALQILDDRYDKVAHSERGRFVKDYLGGKDLELLFSIHEPRKKSSEPEPKGISISYGKGHWNDWRDVKGNFTANVPTQEIVPEPSDGTKITYGEGHIHAER